jgi:hypothetical protein
MHSHAEADYLSVRRRTDNDRTRLASCQARFICQLARRSTIVKEVVGSISMRVAKEVAHAPNSSCVVGCAAGSVPIGVQRLGTVWRFAGGYGRSGGDRLSVARVAA